MFYIFFASFFCGSVRYVLFALSHFFLRTLVPSGLIQNFVCVCVCVGGGASRNNI